MSSCNFWSKPKDEDPIAKVNGRYLYPSDLIAPGEEGVDAGTWNESQVDNWIRRELWYVQAEKEGASFEIQEKLEDYKRSLMIAAYQESLLASSNIIITEEAIKAYYKENMGAYKLKEDLFHLEYYILPNDDKAEKILDDLNKNFSNEDLSLYCQEHNDSCMSQGLWVEELMLQDLGLPQYLWTSSPKFQQYYLDDDFVCVYRIESKRKSGEAIPLDQVRSEIILLLQFQQEKEILKKKEEELFLNAQNKKNFEIYK